MLHNLLKARTILNKDPKTNQADLLKRSGLSRDELLYLVEKKIIEKRGRTRGSEWHWVGAKPDYAMIQEFMGVNSFQETQGVLDVVVDRFDLSMKISDNITLRLISDKSVGLRRNEGEEVVVSDPVKLKEILSLIS